MLHDYLPPKTHSAVSPYCVYHISVYPPASKNPILCSKRVQLYRLIHCLYFRKRKKNPSNYHSDFCTLSTVFDYFILNMFECQYIGTNCIFSQELHGTLLCRGNTVHLTSSLLRDTQVFHELLLCQQRFNGHLSA